MSFIDAKLPALSDAFVPPIVRGTADLTHFAYQGYDYEALMARIGELLGRNPPDAEEAAWTYDAAIVAQLGFRRAEGLNLQDAALAAAQVYRIEAGDGGPQSEQPPLRLLALVGPGDLMTNTPLDFLTNHLNVRLDLLYVLPGRGLPPVIPDHDVAFFAVGEADPATLTRLRRLYAAWPRPALNDPRFLPGLERDALSQCLVGIPGLCSPTAVTVSRAALDAHLATGRPIEGVDLPDGPYLIRPVGSHAGTGLSRIQTTADLSEYLRFSFERQFFLTAFEDYKSSDRLYRKSRVAFIDRQPFLCHMAISQHWMVHYLNASMTESAERRAEEAGAMASFEAGFARRHAAAFDALHERLDFDYYSIDCAETRDGRLLVFEADTAAIVHLMDPPELFPYKQPAMRKVFAAFDAMLRRRAELTRPLLRSVTG
ncbi:hypothetical protein [Acidisphaera sp. S103]|uniref:hypothetical protein n=1 Tax=Acidisphaera sp. S103 TaxID=1747223 RepID=UPI00131A7A6E|nr:hypothetical protein [Acidisphaera sp. S103]